MLYYSLLNNYKYGNNNKLNLTYQMLKSRAGEVDNLFDITSYPPSTITNVCSN